MVAGIIALIGVLAIWIGITGRGNSFWQAITGTIPTVDFHHQ